MEAKSNRTLYAVGIGLFLSDLIPTPADALYFNYQQRNKQKLEEGKITPSQYWNKEAVAYYGFNAAWWGGVLAASYFLGSTHNQKRNILLGLIAGGVVVSVIHKNIKKDEIFYSKK